MSMHFILQRFAAGRPVPFDYSSAIELLSGYGQLGSGLADRELRFNDSDLATSAIIVGQPERGVECILIEHPKPCAGLQNFVFDAMQRLDVAAFDDELTAVYLHVDSAIELPAELSAATAAGVQRIISPWQIWPQTIALPAASSLQYGVLFDNPNPAGGAYQMVDDLAPEAALIGYRFHTHPAACNPAVGRALRQILLRLELARRSLASREGRPWRVELYFQSNDAWLPVLEAPRPAALECAATTVTPMPGDLLEPYRNAFGADLDALATAEWNAARCAAQANEEFGIRLATGGAGAEQLDRLLQQLHGRLQSNGGSSGFGRELSTRWCWLAGSFLGELARHQVGGQWGYQTIAGDRHPLLRAHNGRLLFPLLRVFDKLLRGSAVDLAAEWRHWCAGAVARSRQLGDHDEVMALPELIQLLSGRRQDAEVPLPFASALAIAELDLSPDSLLTLDRWLTQLRAQRAHCSPLQVTRSVRYAGAYLGEVIRRAQPNAWLWENYLDYFDGSPGLPEVPSGLQSAVVLRGHGQLLFPYGVVVGRLEGEETRSLLQWAREQASGFAEWTDSWRRAGNPERGPDYYHEFSEQRAPHHATSLRASDAGLDGSLASIQRVDQQIAELRESELDAKQRSDRLGQLCCYAGQLAVDHLDARWRASGQTRLAASSRSPIVLQTASGSVLDPFAVALRMLRLPGKHSLEAILLAIMNERRCRQADASERGGNGTPASVAQPSEPDRLRAAQAQAEAIMQAGMQAQAALRPRPQSGFPMSVALFWAPLGGVLAAMSYGAAAGWWVFAGTVGGGWLWRRFLR